MLDLQGEIARAKAQGDKEVAGFNGAVRSTDVLTVNVGETFTIPQDFKVFETHFVGGDGVTRTSQYCWVNLENGESRKFFPTTFTRLRVAFNEDGTSTGERIYAKGTAVDEYKKYPKVQEAIKALAGKKIKYADRVAVRTKGFNSDNIITDYLPVFDLVA